jgi:hypothetical protein
MEINEYVKNVASEMERRGFSVSGIFERGQGAAFVASQVCDADLYRPDNVEVTCEPTPAGFALNVEQIDGRTIFKREVANSAYLPSAGAISDMVFQAQA